jgi:hypothetical protein
MCLWLSNAPYVSTQVACCVSPVARCFCAASFPILGIADNGRFRRKSFSQSQVISSIYNIPPLESRWSFVRNIHNYLSLSPVLNHSLRTTSLYYKILSSTPLPLFFFPPQSANRKSGGIINMASSTNGKGVQNSVVSTSTENHRAIQMPRRHR